MSLPDQLKILIVEDDAIIAQLLEMYVQQANHVVAGVEHTAENAINILKRQSIDMVLLDINLLGKIDGIDIAKIINDQHKIPFIFVTAHSDKTTIERVAAVHPSGYIIKPFRAEEIYSAITIGKFNFDRRQNKKVITKEFIDSKSHSPLTKKEFELLLDISLGLSNDQIANKNNLSLNTIKWHTQNIYSKLGVKNRTSAAQLALNNE